MKHIRAWIVRTIFGQAKSEPPDDENGQARLSWKEIHEPTPAHRKEGQ